MRHVVTRAAADESREPAGRRTSLSPVRPARPAPGASVRVVLADGNQTLRFALRAALAIAPGIEIAAEAATGDEAVEQVMLHRPDVLLLDVRMPPLDGLALIPRIRHVTRVVVLSGAEDPETILRAVGSGARGYLVHGEFEPGELINVVTGTARGRTFLSPHAAAILVDRIQDHHGQADPGAKLTPREREIMNLIAEGLPNWQIAKYLVISEKTVKNHICNIYRRLDVAGRRQAVAHWLSR